MAGQQSGSIRINVFIVLLGCASAHAWAAEASKISNKFGNDDYLLERCLRWGRDCKATKTIKKPRHDGYRLDRCLRWGRDCNEPAASAYCGDIGFERAISYKIDYNIGDRDPTKVFIGGDICSGRSCGGFKEITCEGSTEALLRNNKNIVGQIAQLNRRNEELDAQVRTLSSDRSKAERLSEHFSRIMASLNSLLANSQVLLERSQLITKWHNAWLSEFHERERANAARWVTLTDLDSYENIGTEVAESVENIPSDASLIKREMYHSQRLGLNEARALSAKIRELLSTSLIEDVHFPELRAQDIALFLPLPFVNLQAYADSFQSFMSRENFLQQPQLHRLFMKPEAIKHFLSVVEQGRQVREMLTNLRIKVEELNATLLEQKASIEQYAPLRRKLRDLWLHRVTSAAMPLLVGQQIEGTGNEVVSLLDDSASPKLAMRKVRVLGVLLKDVEDNLAKLHVSDALRDKLKHQMSISEGWDTYHNYSAILEVLLTQGDQLAYYADTRFNLAEYALNNLYEPSGDCQSLWEQIVLRGTDVEDELKFMEVMQSCGEN